MAKKELTEKQREALEILKQEYGATAEDVAFYLQTSPQAAGRMLHALQAASLAYYTTLLPKYGHKGKAVWYPVLEHEGG